MNNKKIHVFLIRKDVFKNKTYKNITFQERKDCMYIEDYSTYKDYLIFAQVDNVFKEGPLESVLIYSDHVSSISLEDNGLKIENVKSVNNDDIVLDPEYRKAIWKSPCFSILEHRPIMNVFCLHKKLGKLVCSFNPCPDLETDTVQGILNARIVLKQRLEFVAKIRKNFLGDKNA